MAATQIPPAIAAVLAASSIPYVTSESPDFVAKHASWARNPAQPTVIVQPKTAEDVSALVSACAAGGYGFVVRSGGHDTGGRSTVEGVVQIDVRSFKSVTISADKKTARVGGGVTFLDVLTELAKDNLVTPVGGIGTVGYVGWSTLGGYGPYSPSYGLGADQIVGAKLVDADGKIVEASEEVLKALRGGGASNWGIVLELTIKVYPVEEIQSGLLIYNSADMKSLFAEYLTKLDAAIQETPIPSQLYMQPLVVEIPGQGNTFALAFTWNGPASAESKAWQERAASFGPCVAQTVQPTTPLANLEGVTAMLPQYVLGHTKTVSLSRYSPQAIEVMAEMAATMPAQQGIGISIHSLDACSPSAQPRDDSTFLVRRSHYMLEIIVCGLTPEAADDALRWGTVSREKLSKVDTAMEETYFSLTWKDELNLEKTFGKHLDYLIELKKKVDPRRVFKYTTPPL
ncbi:FAD-binding domain-containing protein [Thozetella sp. PMI_491]|nr:FAD-binding domain-containing protein [Thozetella sp. PMI_491]